MELVERATLAERIGRGPVGVDEALPIAKQIARRSRRHTSRAKTTGTPSRFDELVASGVIRPPLEAGDPNGGLA
jgi:hypothetical protein